MTLVYSKQPSWQLTLGIGEDLIIGLGVSALCLVIANWKGVAAYQDSWKMALIFRMSSEFSYSLYLIHFPVLVFFSASIFPSLQMNAEPIGYAAYFGALVLLMGLGYLFWFAFEKKTPQIRKYIVSRIHCFRKA